MCSTISVEPAPRENRDVPQGKLLGFAEYRVLTTLLDRVRVSTTSKYELKIR